MKRACKSSSSKLLAVDKAAVQFITHQTERYTYTESARLALEGGCRWIQLRMKEAPVDEVEQKALEVKAMCRAYRATFIVDDHVEVAKRVGADGVHLGKNDMPIKQAREILGPQAIIGGTANTFDEVKRLWTDGADYIGCGPYQYTTTKKNLARILGIEGYKEIVACLKREGIDLPIVAIGGIACPDIPALVAIGINGIALSGSILNADNPVEEMRRIIQCMEKL